MAITPPQDPPAALAAPPERSRRGARLFLPALQAAPALAALVAWRVSLRHLDVSHLDSYGLPAVLPPAWYGALLLAVTGASVTIAARRMNGWVIAVYLVAVAVILYGTVPVVSAPPHYSWVYKHLGVTRLLESSGRVDISIDIYNRWPGFFAFAGAFAKLAGSPNPEAFAAWAELFFTLIDAVLVAVVVRAVSRSSRVAAGAVLVFVVANWVGQNYFSPQALAYTLSLALLVVVTRQLQRPDGRGERWLARAIERISKTPQQPPEEAHPTWPRWAAVGAVLALDAIIVGSHQLTPYVVLVQMVLLMLTGLLRTSWFIAVMALMTFAYLAANLGYIEHNFGLFTSFDPFNNLQNGSIYGTSQQGGKVLSAHAGQLLSAAVWLGSAVAALRLARRGLLRRALPLVLFAASPFVVIFGQSYGGEASLRMVLFSVPWCGALIAWALSTVRRPLLAQLAGATAAVAMAALFVPAFLGSEELNIMPAGEVAASDWFYAHAPRNAVLMQAAPDFPARYGPNYRFVAGPQSDDDPNLLRIKLFRHRRLGPADVGDVISIIHQYARRGYLVFAKTETKFAEVFRLTPPDALAQLQRAVAESRAFRLIYANGDAQIYELLPGVTTLRPRASGSRVRSSRARSSRAKAAGGRRTRLVPKRRVFARKARTLHLLGQRSPLTQAARGGAR